MMITEHKGLPVRKHTVAVRGASGDALNGAMKVAPQDFQPGEKAYMVLEVEPNGETFKPMDDGEAYEEMEIVKVKRGAFMDAKTALPLLDDVTVQLADLKAKEAGQDKLAESITLEADHRAGLHKRKRQGCSDCFPSSDEEHAKADESDVKVGDLDKARSARATGAKNRAPRPSRARGAAKKK